MAQQHLLDLARIDVHAAADDQVLGAVLQREVAVRVEAADVAGVQPAAAQRLGGGLGLVPVAGHHHVAPDQDLADLAGGELAVVVVDDADLDAGAGDADALQRSRQRGWSRSAWSCFDSAVIVIGVSPWP